MYVINFVRNIKYIPLQFNRLESYINMEQSYYDSNQYNTNTTNSMAPRNIRSIKAAARGQLFGNYSPIIGCGLLLFLIQQILGSVFSNMLMIRPGAVQYIIYYAAMIIISMLVIFFQAGLYRMHLNAAAGQPVTSKDLAFAVRHNPNRFLISGLILTLISFLFQIPESILSSSVSMHLLKAMNDMGFTAVEAPQVPAIQTIRIAAICTLIGLILYILLMLRFALVLFLLVENEHMEAKEAFSLSFRLMKGNTGRLFGLMISFIGLWILGLLSFGIGYLWILPYMKQALTVFYEGLRPDDAYAFR